MVYTANIPQATDTPAQSQPLMLANFQELDDQYGVSGDHVAFTAVSNNGQHNKVTWVDQSAGVPAAPGATKVVAYGKTSGGITMPYYKRDIIATEFPLSPIKAYGAISLTTVPVATLLNSFNVTSATASAITNGYSVSVVLTNAMASSNYGVLLSMQGQGASSRSMELGYIITNTTNFTISIFQISGSLVSPTQITFAVLEV